MNRIITLILSLLISFSALAFNFTGKTFRGTNVFPDGSKATITFVFRANNKVSSTLSRTGSRTQSTTLLWEESGDFINFYDPATGDLMVFGVEDEYDDNGNFSGVALIGYDSLGNEAMRLRQVKSSPAKKSSGKKRK